MFYAEMFNMEKTLISKGNLFTEAVSAKLQNEQGAHTQSHTKMLIRVWGAFFP